MKRQAKTTIKTIKGRREFPAMILGYQGFPLTSGRVDTFFRFAKKCGHTPTACYSQKSFFFSDFEDLDFLEILKDLRPFF